MSGGVITMEDKNGRIAVAPTKVKATLASIPVATESLVSRPVSSKSLLLRVGSSTVEYVVTIIVSHLWEIEIAIFSMCGRFFYNFNAFYVYSASMQYARYTIILQQWLIRCIRHCHKAAIFVYKWTKRFQYWSVVQWSKIYSHEKIDIKIDQFFKKSNQNRSKL